MFALINEMEMVLKINTSIIFRKTGPISGGGEVQPLKSGVASLGGGEKKGKEGDSPVKKYSANMKGC